MATTIIEIEKYLKEVKSAILIGKYRFEINSNRPDNRELFTNYIIDEEKCKQILLSLTPIDFSEILQNEHKGYEHEKLYVFGKDVDLIQRFGAEKEAVSLYIKFNKLEGQYVIIISFHKQKYPIKYKFK